MNRIPLIVFIKNFQPGKVKTRLASTLTDKKALEIYRQLCIFTVEEVKKTNQPAWFYFSEYVDTAFLNERGLVVDHDFYKARVQAGADLGSKMFGAFKEVLRESECAFILGTDCPYLDSKKIMKGVDLLDQDRTDVVIGPAADGGYYGLGMNGLYDVFSSVEYSTDKVLSQTIRRLEDMGVKYDFLQKLNDIDHESDWTQFQKSSSAIYFKEVIRSSSLDSDTVDE